MSRFSRYDSDDDRLPDGMRRVGYDADTQVYTFQDSDGGYWESAPGCEYGQLSRVGDSMLEEAADTEPFLVHDGPAQRKSWRAELMPLLNFGIIIGVSLLGLFWYLHWAAGDEGDLRPACTPDQSAYVIRTGDTCWAIGEKRGISVDDLLKTNNGLDCDHLSVGSIICLPG